MPSNTSSTAARISREACDSQAIWRREMPSGTASATKLSTIAIICSKVLRSDRRLLNP